MRLFVAIDLPGAVQAGLAALSGSLPGARWVPRAQQHLTLRFIGEVDEVLYHDIYAALAQVEAAGFAMTLRGVGHFPPRRAHGILWVGLADSDPLVALRNKVESVLVGCGLTPERRTFCPHITLARLKKTPPQRLSRFLADNGQFSLPAFPVTTFALYSSALTSAGAVHTVEAVYQLS